VDQERFVFVFTEDVLEEVVAGVALLIDQAALAAAGIHQQPQDQGSVGLLGEILDRLHAAVFFEREIVLGEIVNDLAVLVADTHQHVDDIYTGRELGRIAFRGVGPRGVGLRRVLPRQQPRCGP